jgi:hypothetical protein
VQGSRGDVDADLLLTGRRLLASGSVRVADVALTLPVSGEPRLRAAALAAILEGFDLSSGAGRISRIEVGAPTLSLTSASALATLAALVESVRSHPDLLIRRLGITEGTLTLDDTGRARIEHMRLSAHAPGVRASGWVVSARAGLGADGEVALDGVLWRDLRALDAATRLRRVAVGPWRPLLGASAKWDAQVSSTVGFDWTWPAMRRRSRSAGMPCWPTSAPPALVAFAPTASRSASGNCTGRAPTRSWTASWSRVQRSRCRPRRHGLG